jgi:hypothetical protein
MIDTSFSMRLLEKETIQQNLIIFLITKRESLVKAMIAIL